MRFHVQARAKSRDGEIESAENSIHFSDASEFLLIVSAATSFNGFDQDPDLARRDEAALAAGYLNAAFSQDYMALKCNHINDYQAYFNRVEFALTGPDRNGIPTDVRLTEYAEGAEDPGLEALYFQFGRYLLISSSRPGGVAANLQGIWNDIMRPPWSSNYTMNINVEMNYWPAEVSNLSELHEPFFSLVKAVAHNGAFTAKKTFGARGWCGGHNSDIWGHSDLVGNLGEGHPIWSIWNMAGPWVCQHLWQHYLFTGDLEFLINTAYPLMKGAAEFCLDYLVEAMEEVDGSLLIIGRGEREKPLKRAVSEKGLEDRIFLLGEISEDDLPHYLHACSVFCLPSVTRNEAFGVCQLEAMACSKPVVSTRLDTGVTFINRDGETGIVVPPRDSAALAVALNKLLDSPELARRMGGNGRSRVETLFTREKMVEATLRLYKELTAIY